MSWAKVGMNCQFIGFPNKPIPVPGSVFHPGMVKPLVNSVYTITNMVWDDIYGALRIVVSGAPNPDAFGQDWGWNVNGFRPVSAKTQEQDVQMFKRIADNAPSLEDVE